MTNCTGNVTRMVTIKGVKTDSDPWRVVTVDITRCTGCPGTAYVSMPDGMGGTEHWVREIPADYARADDSIAAYWAAEATAYTAPDRVDVKCVRCGRVGEVTLTDLFERLCEACLTAVPAEVELLEGDFVIEDEDGSEAFGRYLERRAEVFENDPF